MKKDNNKTSIQKTILALILFFVLYNIFIGSSSSSSNSINSTSSSKEDALKHVQSYVKQLEHDVVNFQHIIEDKIKPQNGFFSNVDLANDVTIDTNAGKRLRGIVKNIGLSIASSKTIQTISKEISKKTESVWHDGISRLFGFSFDTKGSDSTNAVDYGDSITNTWAEGLRRKLNCLYGGKGAIYLYHMRKTAGSSIRDILDFATKRWKVRYMFTEGKTLDERLLEPPGIFRVISLREPISRIESLYWYEHVSWYLSVKKDTKKVYKFREWFDSWCDGSEWKTIFITKNPGSVYVEVENYYTKVLSGWTGPEPVSRKDLLTAKANLEKFDFVLIQEWMADISQVDAMTALFPGRLNIAAGSKVKGDKDVKQRYESIFSPDIASLREKMKIINKYDIELYEYARFLTAQRVKLVPDIVDSVMNNIQKTSPKECSVLMDHKLYNKLGLFQPFGHKGPFKNTDD
jgi:hypothetical protein